MRVPTLTISALLLLISSGPVFAHKMMITCRLEGDRLRLEAYYEDDTPAQDTRISITRDGETIAEGRTDERGVWIWLCPPAGEYLLKAMSTGHTASETITVPDVSDHRPEIDQGAEYRRDSVGVQWIKLGYGLLILLVLASGWKIAKRPRT